MNKSIANNLKIEDNLNVLPKIKKVMVIGSGYVGLPTAALFAEAGFSVTSVDIRPSMVDSINNGTSPIVEPGLQDLVSRNVKAGRLGGKLATDAPIAAQDAVLICVQTPINERNEPQLSFLISAIDAVGKQLRENMLVVVCSTVPPGTLRDRLKPILDSCSGLTADVGYFLAFVPERIAPGKAIQEFVESPRIVGGIGPNSTKIAADLFRTVCKEVIPTDAINAEIAKTAENTFRDVNIAFANQLALICQHHGADVINVIKLANTHPRVNIHLPGPGVGGPCLTKDPYLLLFGISCPADEANIIMSARLTNDQMPHHVVELIKGALAKSDKEVNGAKVVILGSAYKAAVDDPRFSPAEPIIRELLQLNLDVSVYDPYCPSAFGAKKIDNLNDAVKNADCLLLVTDHPEFKQLNLSELKALMNKNPSIIDARRAINPQEAITAGFQYYGIGFSEKT